MKVVSVTAMLLLLAGCQRGTKLEVPTADIVEDTEDPPLVPLTSSYVSSPIIFDLRPLLEELEEAVPRILGSIEKDRRIKVVGTPSVSVAPELHRQPFDFGFEGNTVTVSTVIEYRARAWVSLFSVSCGMDSLRPRMRVKLATTYDLTPTWHLKTHTRVLELEPLSRTERDQCEVSGARIDVTPKIATAARGALDGALAKLDAKLAKVSVRAPVEKLWQEIQKPISISKQTLWLDIGPQELSLGPITANDSTLVARLDLMARPRIVGGARPVPDSAPLPPLGHSQAMIDTADVRMEGLLAWDAADKLLGKELVGKTIGSGWKKVRIDSLSASSAGRGRMLLRATVSGAAHGTLNVIGTPTYDPATDLITMPDLDFDINSAGYLASAAGWLVSGPFIDEVRAAAHIPGATLMNEVLTLANKELDRKLTDGVELRGDLSGARVLSVRARREGLYAEGAGTGRLWIEISKHDLLPERKLKKKPPTTSAKR